MSKTTKFFKHPVLFFKDAKKNKIARQKQDGKKSGFDASKYRGEDDSIDTMIIVGFSAWKTFIRRYFKSSKVVFIPKEITASEFRGKYQREFETNPQNTTVLVWGTLLPNFVKRAALKNSIGIKYVEDGFIRSVQLGASKAPPMSLVYDSKVPYFDSRYPSDLENLLNNYDFDANVDLMEEASECIELIVSNKISKYNHARHYDMNKVYGQKLRRRILVIGQVEDDASIKLGCDRPVTNNALVRLAKKENPEAEIIYKPHPDVLNGFRKMQSNPEDVANIAKIIGDDISIAQSFETIDHVYTITSLSGFEALLRGIKVTTIGSPFYSGWGLTDDRQPNSRRNRKLTVQQVFAATYLLYGRYYDLDSGDSITLKDTVKKIIRQREFIDLMDDSVGVNRELESNKAIANPNIVESLHSKAIKIDEPSEENSYVYLCDETKKSNELYRKLVKLNPSFGVVKLSCLKQIGFNSSLDEIHAISSELAKEFASVNFSLQGVVFSGVLSDFAVLAFKVCKKLGLRTVYIGVDSSDYSSKNIGDFAFDTYYSSKVIPEDSKCVLKGCSKVKHVRALNLPLADVRALGNALSYSQLLISSNNKELVFLAVDDRCEPDVLFNAVLNYFPRFSYCLVLYSYDESTGNQLYGMFQESGYEVFYRDILLGILSFEETVYVAEYALSNMQGESLASLKEVRDGEIYDIQSLYLEGAPLPEARKIGDMISSGTVKEDIDFLEVSDAVSESYSYLSNGLSVVLQSRYSTRYAAHSGKGAWKQAQRYLPQMLDAYKRDITVDADTPVSQLAKCDYFIQWGAKLTEKKIRQQKLASALMMPNYIAEDGFIRSIDIGLSGDPGLSIILDEKAAYYDAFSKSSLVEALESDYELTSQELERAANLISLIKAKRVTKYNHAPHINASIGRVGVPKILLIDQRYGDQSIISGKADERSFGRMLKHAIEEYPSYDIVVKRHPDATKGGKQSYFSSENIAFAENLERVILIDYEINPYCLFKQVDEVWVATSGMGLEALIAGKKVRCYGEPFYSGWGITQEMLENGTPRARKRSLEDIVFFSYIVFSKYFSPSTMMRCEVEDLVEYISKNIDENSYI